MPTTREPARRILIVGASARAAAASATRAGLVPLAIDRFNDVDLSEICEQCGAYRLASDIPRLADEFASGDWIYTGPLENYPRVLQSLAAKRRLLGNDFETVKQLRDPWNLYDCLHDAGLAAPKVCRWVLELDDGLWLKKPLRSAGGCGIEACVRPPDEPQHHVETRHARSSYYYQQYVAGTSYSAIFLAASKQAALLGVTEQLIGPKWNAAGAYQYAGSIGPVTLPSAHHTQLRRLAASLSERFELQGLFGVDFILTENNVWPVEVNPRYTASAEVIELATNLPLLKYHVEACLNQLLPSSPIFEPSLFAGKLILYAKNATKVCRAFVEQMARQVAECGDGEIADIPRTGTELLPGDPICTVLLTAATVDDVRRRLATIIES